MASFFTELWESIFTPGPTPVLVRAANATFAALQLVLLVLLAATHNLHYLALSVLSAGLWGSINWFINELAAQEHAAAADTKTQSPGEKPPAGDTTRTRTRTTSTKAGGIAGSDDSDTEVEGTAVKPSVVVGGSKTKRAAAAAAAAVASTSEAEPVEHIHELRQRGEKPPPPETQSSVSTEDEWEKVSESGKDNKDK